MIRGDLEVLKDWCYEAVSIQFLMGENLYYSYKK